MDVEFFVHGIPKGQDFWGNEEERAFIGNFYDNSDDKQKFVIQARTVNGKQYFYYSYLVHADIVDSESRAGSYYGMTLRLDQLCIDFMNVYRILDVVFNSYVIGKLLVKDKSKLKYLVSKFEDSEIKEIQDKVMQLLQDTLSNDSFSKVSGIAVTGDRYTKWNIYDFTKDSLLKAISQYGKIALSPYYPSILESSARQQCENKIKSIQQQYQALINENTSEYEKKEQNTNTELKSQKGQIAKLETSTKSKDKENAELKAKVAGLKRTIEHENQNKELSDLIERIKAPVKSLSDALENRNVEKRGGRYGYNHKYDISKLIRNHRIFIIIIIIAIVGVILICMRYCGNKTNSDKPYEQTDPTQASRTETVQDQNESEEISDTVSNNTTANPFSVTSDFNINNVKIDIEDHKGERLKRRETYTVRAINGSENGEWEVEGCQINEKDAKKIVITPTGTSVKIKYKVGNKEKAITRITE